MLQPSISQYRATHWLLRTKHALAQLPASLQDVEYAELCDIDFTSQAKRRRQLCTELLQLQKASINVTQSYLGLASQ